MTYKDFRFTEQMAYKVEGMDVKVEQSVTFWIVACEVMEIITDKMFFVQTLAKDLHGRGMTFLQANHSNG